MLFFSGSSNEHLAKKVAEASYTSLAPIELHTFPDGEKRVMVSEKAIGDDCVVIESTSPPVDMHCMELFFIIDALKRTGARSVTCVIPYFGYERQDHIFRIGEARSLEVVIRILESFDIKRVISFDFHSVKIQEVFTIPVTHLSALPLFAEVIKEKGLNDEKSILVSPDMGGIRRIEELSRDLSDMPYLAVEKNRDLVSGSIESSVFHGDLEGRTRALIVDDIMASGKTVVAAADLLMKNGIKEVYVFATHPVFAPEAPDILQNSNIKKIFVTDTIQLRDDQKFEKLEIVSVAPLITSNL